MNILPNETDVFAAMMQQNSDLQRQQQAAAKQLQDEQSTTVSGNISSVTITGSAPTVAPIHNVEPITSGNLTDRIKAMESKINSTKKLEPSRSGADFYKDDYGHTTWYIKNESGMIVSLGDAMGVVIGKGEVIDLLGRVSEDVITKSKDFIARLRNNAGGLRRLTQEEYFSELQMQDEQNSKITALETAKYLNSPEGVRTPQTIRPLIESQLNKLDLHFDKNPEISVLGIEPLVFIKWIMGEKFSIEEIDSMLGYPRVRSNTDITSSLIRKRSELTK